MVDYRRILQLRSEDISQRGIAEALRCSRNTVAAVFAQADVQGISFDEVASLDNGEIRDLLFFKATDKTTKRTAPDFEFVHKELARKNVTLLMLWNAYANRCRLAGEVPYQYSYFCEQYRKWASVTNATLHIPRTAGEITEVDWASTTMQYVDELTGEVKDGYLFVATLAYSVYKYVEAFADMRLSSWIEAHINAFEFFSGTTRLLVPDNLRAGVTKADRYEPVLNATYLAMADYYGITVIPSRVARPKDKPAVEGSVGHIAGSIAGTLRDRRFIGLFELNEAIFERLEVLNAKPFQKREDSRKIVFERDELPVLKRLPAVRFEPSELVKRKVAPNYHIQVDGSFYSVPHRLIGATLDVRITPRTIEVFSGSERVCTHTRTHNKKGAYFTIEQHMPSYHREYLSDWTPERFTSWAKTIGPFTVTAIEKILQSKKIVEQTYRSCLGVMSIARKDGGIARLEESCKRALELTGSPTYTMIKNIASDWQPETKKAQASLGEKGFVRGSDYFKEVDSK
jgi:transposase